MSSGPSGVMRPGVTERPRYCHVCGWERTSEADFVQQFRGYAVDYYGNSNPVYQTTCINCGNPSTFPYNISVPAGLTVPDDWIGVAADVVGIGAGMAMVADGSVVWVPPVLDSINPDRARRGSSDTTIMVVGDDFQDGAVVMAIGGTVMLMTTGIDQQNLTAIMPAGLMVNRGDIDVMVRNPDGQTSGVMIFTVTL